MTIFVRCLSWLILVFVPATECAFAHPPSGIVMAKDGSVFFLRIHVPHLVRLDLSAKVVTTYDHYLSSAHKLGIDLDGNVYFAGSRAISKQSPNGKITTVAKWQVKAALSDGAPKETAFIHPHTPLAVNSKGVLYCFRTGAPGEKGKHQLLSVDPDGEVRIVAGGLIGHQDGRGAEARFQEIHASSMTCGKGGVLYLTDGGTYIRRIGPDGAVTTLAGGSENGYSDGKGAEARFNHAYGIDVDKDGNVYVADGWNRRIRKVTPDGQVTTIAGNGQRKVADGPALQASFDYPSGVAVSPAGELFILDTAKKLRVRLLTKDGKVTTVAETGFAASSKDKRVIVFK